MSRRRIVTLLGVLALALPIFLSACAGPDCGDDDAGRTDGGSRPDGGSHSDAGTPDAGTPDAGTPDAGTPDAGTPDAGTPDAGTPDAGTPDAGTPDAGTPDAGTPDAGTVENLTPEPVGDAIGTFTVSVVAPAGTTAGTASFAGKVQSGPVVPVNLFLRKASSGDCRLLVPYAPTCAPACATGATCVAKDTCLAKPTALAIGDITATGLVKSGNSAAGFTTTPIRNSFSEILAYPPFAEGDAISLKSAGSTTVPSFTLRSTGVAPLLLSTDTVELARDRSATLRWTAPGRSDVAAKVRVEVDISHHGGGLKGLLVCEAADTGSVTLPASLVTGLIDLGVAGYPKVTLTRRATGSATLSIGRVDLNVESAAKKDLTVQGFLSCTPTDADPTGGCPSGQTCSAQLLCVDQ